MGLATGTRHGYTLTAEELIIKSEDVIFYRTMPENTDEVTEPFEEADGQQEAVSYPVYGPYIEVICNSFITSIQDDMAVLLDLNGKDITPDWVKEHQIRMITNISDTIFRVEANTHDQFRYGFADTDLNLILEPKYKIGWTMDSRYVLYKGLDATYERVEAEGIFDIENKKILIENNWNSINCFSKVDNEGIRRYYFQLMDAQGQLSYMDEEGNSLTSSQVDEIMQKNEDNNNTITYSGNSHLIEQLDFSKIEAVTTNYEKRYSYPSYYRNPKNYPTEVFRYSTSDPILGSLWGLIHIDGTVIVEGFDYVELLYRDPVNEGMTIEAMGWICKKGNTYEIYSLDGKYKYVVEGIDEYAVVSISDQLLAVEFDQNRGGQLIYLPTCTKLTETSTYSDILGNMVECFGTAALVKDKTGNKNLVSYSGKVLHENVDLVSFNEGDTLVVLRNVKEGTGYYECFVRDLIGNKAYDTFRFQYKSNNIY
ncbi:MAG TPA: hypothetical protein GXZ28_07170 [Clostridiales bacterium]|nr:hypothetical protein [Clostridiales bacterium]